MPSERALRIACALLSASILVGGPRCVYYCLVAVILLTIAASPIVFYCQVSTLTDKSLSRDIQAVELAAGPLFHQILSKKFDEDSVYNYYRETTDRDFRLLERFMGPGMHTCLHAAHPVGGQGGMTRQPALVMAEVRGCDARRVLEVGCGKGHCSLFLAGACPDVTFRGIDLVAKNVQIAKADAGASLLPNVEFDVGDSTSIGAEARFGLIFGCESLCHMDTAEKAALFVKGASAMLAPGGRVVIIDGFAGESLHKCTPDQRRAMELAEGGFSIKKMPSKVMWVELFAYAGMRLVRDAPLTHEALPFWTMGWRVFRGVFASPWIARQVVSRMRRETVATLISVAMTAHAMRSGAAEYGMLVFEKP